MFAVGLLIGTFGYLIFTLGVTSLLYPAVLRVVTVIFLILAVGVWYLLWKKQIIRNSSISSIFKDFQSDMRNWVLIILLMTLSLVYLVGAFIPERAFDALWYHLTIPKLYLQNHQMYHIPGGLLFYSQMPKLTEMLYTAALSFGDDLYTRLIHFGFGMGVTLGIFIWMRKFYSVYVSLVASVLFYSNIVVGWESTTAYIDLARTFFEVLALCAFMNYVETGKKVWFVESAVMLGLAMSTKLIAAGSLIIFAGLIWYTLRNESIFLRMRKIILYGLVSFAIVSPWLVLSFVNTSNPIYPLFTDYYPVSMISFVHIPSDLFNVLVRSDDPIHPLYLACVPLLFIFYRHFNAREKIIVVYCFLALLVWTLTPRTGGGRFMMVYLPSFSILTALTLRHLSGRLLQQVAFGCVVLVAIITLGYRTAAQMHALDYLTGVQSKDEYLTHELNFQYGDFYDVDGYFENNIAPDERILIYGIHNLYYVNVPFIHESYIESGDTFHYILTGKNTQLPERFRYWTKIYENEKTHVKLYSQGGQQWVY